MKVSNAGTYTVTVGVRDFPTDDLWSELERRGAVRRLGHMIGESEVAMCPADCGGDDVYRAVGSDRDV